MRAPIMRSKNLSHADHAVRIPRIARNFVVRAYERQIHAYGVGTQATDDIVGIHDIPLGFTHLLAVGAQTSMPRFIAMHVRRSSLSATNPLSNSALCQKRLYKRCIVVCSAPPEYISTGIQFACFYPLASQNSFSFFGSE